MCLNRQQKATTDRRVRKNVPQPIRRAPPEETEKGVCRYPPRTNGTYRSYKEIQHRPSGGTRSAGSQSATTPGGRGSGKHPRSTELRTHRSPPPTPRTPQRPGAGGNRRQPKRRRGTSPHTQRFPASLGTTAKMTPAAGGHRRCLAAASKQPGGHKNNPPDASVNRNPPANAR